jgi:hypothetical protein
MSFPPPANPIPKGVATKELNPLEMGIASINTNTYLIGMSMILLNLGGRHLSTSLTTTQDKFFQNPYIRPFMLFVVIFVATRNILTALWLAIGIIFAIGFLLNEHSTFYLLGDPIPPPKPVQPLQVPTGLTPEENDIYKKLHEKAEVLKQKEEEQKKNEGAAEKKEDSSEWYSKNMRSLRELIGIA